MNETGIVRRIDELGRIVVPKEIRSSMRLAEGSMLEFCINGENLVLKKYNQLSAINEAVNALAKTLAKQLGSAVCFVGDGEVLACVGKEKISTQNFDTTRRTQYETMVDTDGGKTSAIITPIISGGDLIGNIVVLSDGNKYACELCKFAAHLVAEYYEN